MDRNRPNTVSAMARALTIGIAGTLAVLVATSGAGAHDGTTSHLWLDHLKPMKNVGTINARGNPIDWTKLKNVPAAFADGLDDGVEVAGPGLTKSFGTFSINWFKIQRRVTTACTKGQAIRSVDGQGVVDCTTGPRALSMTVANTGVMCNSQCTEGTLTLAPGKWSITAAITAWQGNGGVHRLHAFCALHAGGLTQPTKYGAEINAAATLSMQLIATLTSNVNASVSCGDNDIGEAYGTDLSIIAVRVD